MDTAVSEWVELPFASVDIGAVPGNSNSDICYLSGGAKTTCKKAETRWVVSCRRNRHLSMDVNIKMCILPERSYCMKVKKHSGELVEFDISRLKGSLSKSGAAPDVVNEVWESMKPFLYEGITTRALYKLAFRLLKKEADSFAARYSLKKALRDLGPTGYHFEEWVGKLFSSAHYQTITGQILVGNSVTHEVDVVAQNSEEMLLIECKFRNTVDAKISVTTPMYFLSRMKDLEGLDFSFFGKKRRFTAGWLVTNAYMTTDSIQFANHYGVHLLAWNYPPESSIKRRVDNAGLYPVTCMTTLIKAEKDKLLQQGCILVKDILDDSSHLRSLDLASRKERRIIQEATELVNYQKKEDYE